MEKMLCKILVRGGGANTSRYALRKNGEWKRAGDDIVHAASPYSFSNYCYYIANKEYPVWVP